MAAMPKPNQSMIDRERGICERARYVRTNLARWSQPQLAKAMGITLNQLAAVEYKRAPLRYRMAIFLCTKFEVNQRWLALGTAPTQPMFDVPMVTGYNISPKTMLFSRVFDGWLDLPTKEIEDGLISMIGEDDFRAGNFDNAVFNNLAPIELPPPKAAAFYVKKLVTQRLNWLPDDLLLKYGNDLLKATESFNRKNAKRLAEVIPPAQREFIAAVKKSDLTKTASPINHEAMQNQWPALKRQLQQATEKSGKSALAKFLKVDLTRISQWLTDAKSQREPGAEYALQMQEWLKRQQT